jgi:AraC-like DNA-binding protein
MGGEVGLSIARAMAPTWTVRHVDFGSLVADESQTRPLGRGIADEARSRLTIVLEGFMLGRTPSRVFEVRPGELLARPRIEDATEGTWGAVLEIDYEGGDLTTIVHGRLHRSTLAVARVVAAALNGTGGRDTPPLDAALQSLSRALASEGLTVALPPARPVDPLAQRYMDSLDGALSDLRSAPAIVDLERALGRDRRSVVRQTHRVHAAHGLVGLGGTDFRAVRDFYRLMVASLLASHPRATLEVIADAVGYASPQSLCHAFHRAGLGSPRVVGTAASALRS